MKTKSIAIQQSLQPSPTECGDYRRLTPLGIIGVVDLRSCVGRQGIAFSYGLLLNGAPAAIVRDDASGGMMRIDWRDPATEEKVTAYAESLAPISCADLGGSRDTLPMTVNLFLAELAAAADAAGVGR